MVCIFDCETILDTNLIQANFHISSHLSEFDSAKEAMQLYSEQHNTTFLPIPYHKVVAISAVITDEDYRFKRVNSIDGEDEETLIKEFFAFINKFNPKLVSFNGRGFDIPMLLIRAMKYNLTIPAYFESDNHQLGKNKWENYRARYSEMFHIDLLEQFNSFGAVRGLTLDLLSQASGIPGKFDLHGDQVLELYYNNEKQKIEEYCESDVLNTYLLYLKYLLLRGDIDHERYQETLRSIELSQKKSYFETFKHFIDKES